MEILETKTFREKAYTDGVFGMTTHFGNPFTLCYTQATSPKKRCGNWGDDLVSKVRTLVLSPSTHIKVGHCTMLSFSTVLSFLQGPLDEEVCRLGN